MIGNEHRYPLVLWEWGEGGGRALPLLLNEISSQRGKYSLDWTTGSGSWIFSIFSVNSTSAVGFVVWLGLGGGAVEVDVDDDVGAIMFPARRTLFRVFEGINIIA